MAVLQGCGWKVRKRSRDTLKPPRNKEHSDRCGQTRTIDLQGAVYTTNDVPGCPNGGLLSGTDEADTLTGEDGEDEVRGFGAADELWGGLGSDVMYGGSGDDFLTGSTVNENDHDTSKMCSREGRAETMWSACGAMTGSTGATATTGCCGETRTRTSSTVGMATIFLWRP